MAGVSPGSASSSLSWNSSPARGTSTCQESCVTVVLLPILQEFFFLRKETAVGLGKFSQESLARTYFWSVISILSILSFSENNI
jgi:hypothetical protein